MRPGCPARGGGISVPSVLVWQTGQSRVTRSASCPRGQLSCQSAGRCVWASRCLQGSWLVQVDGWVRTGWAQGGHGLHSRPLLPPAHLPSLPRGTRSSQACSHTTRTCLWHHWGTGMAGACVLASPPRMAVAVFHKVPWGGGAVCVNQLRGAGWSVCG